MGHSSANEGSVSRSVHIGLCVILLGILLVSGASASAQPAQPALPEGILSLNDVPEGARLLHDRVLPREEMSHPLATGAVSQYQSGATGSVIDQIDQSVLLSYTGGRGSLVLAPVQGVAISTFSYEFSTEAQTTQAAEALWSASQRPVVTSLPEVKGKNGLTGRGFQLVGDAGDSVYWFMGTQGKTLLLLLFNGMEEPAVSSLYATTMQTIADK